MRASSQVHVSRAAPGAVLRPCGAMADEKVLERSSPSKGGASAGPGRQYEAYFCPVNQELMKRRPDQPGNLQPRLHQMLSSSAADLWHLLSQGRCSMTTGLERMITLEGCVSKTRIEAMVSRCVPTRHERAMDEDSGSSKGSLAPDRTLQIRALSIPVSPALDPGNLMNALSQWLASALKSFLCLVPGMPVLDVSVVQRTALPSTLRVYRSSFLGDGVLEKGLATHVGVFSLTSAVMFIGSIRGLNKHSTAQEGNMLGVLATALGIASVIASPGFHGAHVRFLTTFLLAGSLGYGVAMTVRMEEMPQLVAAFHSFVGLAAVSAGFASFFHPAPFHTLRALETFAGTAIGALTFTGSVVAAGKLHGLIRGAPIILERRWALNLGGALGSLILALLFTRPEVYTSSWFGTTCLTANTAIWGFLGTNMVLPIGGADMPVVVSLLNACSGLATSASGFMLSNNLLTITGALVASSGTLLSDIMCRGINRSMYNVLLGGFGTDGGAVLGASGAPAGPVHEVSPVGAAELLLGARRVVIVPGFGLAVARCQQRLAEIVSLLRSHGVTVHFAIHPVAGRLPGHMNVLLAEADVPYDIVMEMEDLNKEISQYDVAIVVGANDIVNPATQTDPGSPIYGMPAVEVWRCKTCLVLKRSMGTGYSGVDNPLFYEENVRMLFGDARQSMDDVFGLLRESQDRIRSTGAASQEAGSGRLVQEEAVAEYPPARKVLGVIRERGPGERRVSITPSVVPRLRRMGFSVLFEAGAGAAAGFSDEDYVEAGAAVGPGFSDEDYVHRGGVQVAESAVEVLKQADVILKVTAPLLDEVQVLQGSQTMIGFWNMFGTDDLLESLGQSMASFVNIALVPRISRAQKLDALTSMANIAGYRAVIDAFNRLPRFSRSSVTACGAVAPAKVFIIGVGVAGLSAIATAHALGAKVYANDVREAAREQVESMGAEFVPVGAAGIAGEGAGGYATDLGEAYKEAQLATYARIVPEMDVVITTAMIPNRAAPVLITEEMLQCMRHGSVVIDLAAPAGGNCAATKQDRVEVTPGGVTVVGETNYPSAMPAQASEMLGSNYAALLEALGGGADFGGSHWDDPVVRAATVLRGGERLWQLAPATSPADAPGVSAPSPMPSVAAAGEVPPPPPGEVSWLLRWLREHQSELALGLGAATVLGMGLTADIPEAELTHIGYFVLSCLIGHFTVAGVTPALHTPLISVTNAISGIIVVGGMLQLNGPLLSARVSCALAAVFLSSVNIVGGFAVTQRMLEMFRREPAR